MTIQYDPRLIEAAVLGAVFGRPQDVALRIARDPLYSIDDVDERETRFHELHAAWFERLELGSPIDRAFSEIALADGSVATILVGLAPSRAKEGADLYVPPSLAGDRTLVVRVRPERFLDPDGLLLFLRRELLHVVDMLDPDFAYDPSSAWQEGDPTHQRIVTNRYRVLWSLTVGGRMARRGWATIGERERCWEGFLQAFPAMSGGAAEEVFSHFFDGWPHRHGELLAFAAEPYAEPGARSSERCPLCRASTQSLAPEPERLPIPVLASIGADFPAWCPADGLCVQCADLYRARPLSAAALAAVPGSS